MPTQGGAGGRDAFLRAHPHEQQRQQRAGAAPSAAVRPATVSAAPSAPAVRPAAVPGPAAVSAAPPAPAVRPASRTRASRSSTVSPSSTASSPIRVSRSISSPISSLPAPRSLPAAAKRIRRPSCSACSAKSKPIPRKRRAARLYKTGGRFLFSGLVRGRGGGARRRTGQGRRGVFRGRPFLGKRKGSTVSVLPFFSDENCTNDPNAKSETVFQENKD